MTSARFLAALFAALVMTASASAQPYPSRPVTFVVPFAAGGPTDMLARLLTERMRIALGQTVIIENATGAAGTIGVGRVVRAPADGYTVSIGHWSTHVVNGAIYALPYDLLKDLEPVAMLPSNPQLIVTKNDVPAKDLKELIAWVKDNQTKISAGTAGAGSASHVSGAYFQEKTGTKFPFIPYRGTGPAIQDLVSGQLDIMFDQSSNSLPHVRGGKIKAYAVTAKSRLPSAPDIPSVDEAGMPGFYIGVWHGLWVPKGTPAEAVQKLTAAVQETLADPAIQKRLAELGQDVPTREQQTPEGLAAHHKAEIEKWWPIIKAANIKARISTATRILRDGASAPPQDEGEKKTGRGLMKAFVALLALLCLNVAAVAQGFPEQSVRILVGFTPGTAPDVVTRLLADKFTESWGKPVVVENVTGAGGNIACDRIAKAAPDGYSLVMCGNGTLVTGRASTTRCRSTR